MAGFLARDMHPKGGMEPKQGEGIAQCVDCGNDAYIQLAPRDGGVMVCAHCYGDRMKRTRVVPPREVVAEEEAEAEISRRS